MTSETHSKDLRASAQLDTFLFIMTSDSVWGDCCFVSLDPGVKYVEQILQPSHSKHVVLAGNSHIVINF